MVHMEFSLSSNLSDSCVKHANYMNFHIFSSKQIHLKKFSVPKVYIRILSSAKIKCIQLILNSFENGLGNLEFIGVSAMVFPMLHKNGHFSHCSRRKECDYCRNWNSGFLTMIQHKRLWFGGT